MSKEVKIGLAIVGVLLIGFGGVVCYRLRGTAEKALEPAEGQSEREALAEFREKSKLLEELNAKTPAPPKTHESPAGLADRTAERYSPGPHHHHSAAPAEVAPVDPLTAASTERYPSRPAPLEDAQESPRYGMTENAQPPFAAAPAKAAEVTPAEAAAAVIVGDAAVPADPFHPKHHHHSETSAANEPGPAPPFAAGTTPGMPMNPVAEMPPPGNPGLFDSNPAVQPAQPLEPAPLQPVAAMGAEGAAQAQFSDPRYNDYRDPARHHEHGTHHNPSSQPAAIEPSTPAQFVAAPYSGSASRNVEPTAPLNSGGSQYDIYGRDVANDRGEPADPPSEAVRSQPMPRADFGQLPVESRAERQFERELKQERQRERFESEAAPGGNETYVVTPNDNFYIISEKVYGSGSYFKALEEHNREKHPYSDKLRVGDVVAVPSIKSLEKQYPDLCPKPRSAPSGMQSSTLEVSMQRRGQGRIYKVQQGDTLFDIAKYELGKASRWAEIYDLNRTQLGDDFDFLAPGMELVLPDNRTAEDPAPLTTQSRQPYNR